MQLIRNSGSRERDSYVRLTLLASVAVCLLVCAFFIRHQDLIASEPAMYLSSAMLSIKGQMPYVDFIQMDWPSTIVSALPSAFLGMLSPACAIPSFNLISMTFSMFAVFISASILLPLRHHRQWHYFPPLILSLSIANVLLVFQVGQPQYFAFFGLVPYLIARWLKYQGIESTKRLLLACGVMASIGIALSPLTILAPLLVETYLRTTFGKTTKVICVESITCLTGLVIFLGGILIFSNANQQANFWSIVLPIMSTDWQFIDITTISKADVPDRRDVLILGSLFLLATPVLSKRFSFLIPIMLLFLSGMFVLVVEQNGLSRNYVLMMGSLTMVSGVAVARTTEWLHRIGKTHKLDLFRRNYGVWLTLWVLIPLASSLLYLAHVEQRITEPRLQENNDKFETLRSVIEHFSKPDQTVLFLQRSTFPEFPLLTQLKRRAGSRLLTPGSVLSLDRWTGNLSPQELQPTIDLNTRLGTMIKDDFVSKKPALVIVEQGAMATKLQTLGIAELLERDYRQVGSYQTSDTNKEPHEWLGTKQPFIVYQIKQQSQTSSLEVTQRNE